MVKRQQYLDKLIKLRDKQAIKVVTGFRRCGKSTLLMQFRDYLKECGVEDGQIIRVNFEQLEFEHLLDHHALGMVKPSGWQTVKYMGLVDGNYLYNRCHLIGYQLAGENANEKNLITGTRYLNVEGMLPFENKVADYIKKYPKRHVLYRVTPIYEGDNLVASGVQMEAYSVEDKGKGVCFNVFCYNVQPGVIIDYSNGKSKLADERVTYISLNYSKYALKAGKTLNLKVYTEPEGVKTGITWFSSNQKVAKVSSNGVVTALKAGTVTITAKTDNGLKAKCKISGLFSQTVGAAIVVESTIVSFFRISPFAVSCSTTCEKAFPAARFLRWQSFFTAPRSVVY